MKKFLVTTLILLLLCSCTAKDKNVGTKDTSSPKPTASTKEIITTKEPTETIEPTTLNTDPITETEIPVMYTDPDKYAGRTITITGVIFTDPEVGEDGVYFQMWQDSKNSDNNTLIICEDKSIEVKEGDYVELSGTVLGKYEGENAFGGSMTAAMVQCSTLKVVSYAEVVAPVIKTIEVNKSIKQHKYEVILEKVEFAENETRLYITVNNNGKANFSLYNFNSKVMQGKKQYDSETNYEADYPEVQTDLLPGASSSGIMCFPKMDPDKELKVYLDGASDNYSLDFKEFVYTVK